MKKTLLILVAICACNLASAETVTPVEKVLPRELADKYHHYLEGFRERHMYMGGTAEALLDEETHGTVVEYAGLGDSQGWAGLTMSAFAFQGGWDLVGEQLGYWEKVRVEPGRYKRWPEMPPGYGHGETSIDQYGEMLMGMAVVAVTGPPELKADIARINREIIEYGKNHGWIMGEGPWTSCRELKFLFQLLAMELDMDIDVYRDGETFDAARVEFLNQFGSAPMIRNYGENYFPMNLMFERLFVAKLLDPGLEGLDAAVRKWYGSVREDGNALFDWFYAEVSGRDASEKVISALGAFPDGLPNEWEPTGYHWGYRWQRSPEEWKEGPSGRNLEHTGMDFLVLASYYSYFQINDF